VIRIGADLGGTKLLLLAEWEGGRSLVRAATGAAFGPPELEAAMASFRAGLPAAPQVVGIAFPGLVGEDGTAVACDVLPRFVGWRPAGGAAIVNDCEAALLAESAAHPPGTALAVVVAGTGIGAAFQEGGRPLRGGHGWAGELGSIPIATAGGARKLDALASGEAILARAGGTFADLEGRLDAGDPAAAALVRDAGEALGLGLAAVIQILDPAVLALGGGVLALPGYLEAAMASAGAHTLPAMWAACAVGRLQDGELAAARGAARAAAATALTA
jgi:predicted NBD/HSP70 family sugar kinase